MGSRYQGADRSTGGYQSRSVDEEERESERQAVLGAFAEAVSDDAGGEGERTTSPTSETATGETDQDTGASRNWPGEASTSRATGGTADETEPQGTSANWPDQRETLSESDARGVVRERISSPESMTADGHRAVVNLLEQAHERGAPLAAVAGGGFDDEIHGWLSVVSGHEDLSGKTKRRAREAVGWLFV